MHGSCSEEWGRSIPQKREICFSRDSSKKPEMWFRELTDGLGNAARSSGDRKLCTWHGQNAGSGGPWWIAGYRAQHLMVRETEKSARCGADYCFSLCLKSCVSKMSCAFQVLGNTCKLNAFLYHQPLQHRQLPSNWLKDHSSKFQFLFFVSFLGWAIWLGALRELSLPWPIS